MQRSEGIKAAVIFTNYGPYHLARAKVLATIPDIEPRFVELARGTGTHPWEVDRQSCPVPLCTLSALPYEHSRFWDLSHALQKTLEDMDPDIVISCGYGLSIMRGAARWARSHGKGSILFHETTQSDQPRYWLKEAAKRWIVRRYYDAAFLGGSRHREYLVGLGMPEEWIWEPYDVVDNDYFSAMATAVRANPKQWREQLGLPDRYFLYVGRCSPEKNLRGLLQAYHRYRMKQPEGWQLVLVGDGPQRAELKDWARASGIGDVRWCGFQQIDELPTYYALSGCFILPSTSEPWGLVVNEAMACGLPVLVSSRCGCTPELVHKEENGFTFDPYDTMAMAELLEQMAALDEPRRELMGAASQKIVSQYTPQVWAENLAQCIRAVVQREREEAP